jgi:hypothetical protein
MTPNAIVDLLREIDPVARCAPDLSLAQAGVDSLGLVALSLEISARGLRLLCELHELAALTPCEIAARLSPN